MSADPAYTVPCFFCGEAVEPSDQSAYRQVRGWERKAVSQSRRGGSDIVLRQPTGELACFGCIERTKAGVNVAQESLL